MKNQPMRIFLLVIIGYELDVKLTVVLIIPDSCFLINDQRAAQFFSV
jgi:hypothetical protein